MTDRSRWEDAQKAEHDYWYPSRADEYRMRRSENGNRKPVFAAMLGLTNPQTVMNKRILDVGAGPSGLLNFIPPNPKIPSVALDPLDISKLDREVYHSRGHVFVQHQAETYVDAKGFDEVWGYNVLQHVEDPAAVMAMVRQHARSAIRWFEWLEVPISVHHPHTIMGDWLKEQLSKTALTRNWETTKLIEGVWTESVWSQKFISIVVEKVS